MTSPRGNIYSENNCGPKTEPWGTLKITTVCPVRLPVTEQYNSLFCLSPCNRAWEALSELIAHHTSSSSQSHVALECNTKECFENEALLCSMSSWLQAFDDEPDLLRVVLFQSPGKSPLSEIVKGVRGAGLTASSHHLSSFCSYHALSSSCSPLDWLSPNLLSGYQWFSGDFTVEILSMK